MRSVRETGRDQGDAAPGAGSVEPGRAEVVRAPGVRGAQAGGDTRADAAPESFLARWIRLCAPYEFPDEYAVFALLACVSAAIDRRIRVNVESVPCPYPALYVILYGPSGTKKGGAIIHATSLFGQAIQTITRYPDDFTMEALFGRLARDSADGGPGARGIVVNEEFADLIGGADYSLRSTALMAKLWDCRPTTSRETRSFKYEEVRDGYLVILGATSPDWLEMIDPRVLAGGFLRRLLLICAWQPKRHEASPVRDRVLEDSLIVDFRARLGPGAFPGGRRMRLTAETREAMGAWYATLRNAPWMRADEKMRHFGSTIQEHVLRVAACVQVLETGDPDVLELEAWDTARGLVEGLLPGMRRAYQSLVPTFTARMKALAARIVIESPGGLIEETALDRAIMRSGGVDVETAQRIRRSCMIERSIVSAPDGRLRVEGD